MKEYLERRLERRLEQGEGGFTLIELLVVMLIIGILLAIAIPTFLSVISTAHSTAAESNLGNAIIEMNAQYTENGGSFFDCSSSTPCTGSPATPTLTMAQQMSSGETNIAYTDSAPVNQNDVQVGFSAANLTGNTSNVAEAMAFSAANDVCYAVFINKSGASYKTSDGTSEGPGTFYGVSTATMTTGCSLGTLTTGGYTVGTTPAMVWRSGGFGAAP
ncbi:MAG: type II secretion system protein [Acidimicrobiales bacterium]|nr:type II secretion system protein [Acidimicrobiales bacterium]